MALYDPQQQPKLSLAATVLQQCLAPAHAQHVAEQLNMYRDNHSPDQTAEMRMLAIQRISATQVQNLAKLALHLRGLPADYTQFSMEYFAATQGTNMNGNTHMYSELVADHYCGSVACAVGHGPGIGLAPLVDEDWDDYQERVFGASVYSRLGSMLFSGSWAAYDNTTAGAAARIAYVVDHPHPATITAIMGRYATTVARRPSAYAQYLD